MTSSSSLAKLSLQSDKLLSSIHSLLSIYQTELFQSTRNFSQFQLYDAQLQTEISELAKTLSALDALACKESLSRREYWKVYANCWIKSEGRRIRASYEELATIRKQVAKLWSVAGKNADHAQVRQKLFSNRDEQLVELYSKEEDSINHSIQSIDNMQEMGKLVMGSMDRQKETLRNSRNRMSTLMNYLGLSNSLMKRISEHEYYDRLILYGGMILTCLVLYLLYIYYVQSE